jgi:hypothetical protein
MATQEINSSISESSLSLYPVLKFFFFFFQAWDLFAYTHQAANGLSKAKWKNRAEVSFRLESTNNQIPISMVNSIFQNTLSEINSSIPFRVVENSQSTNSISFSDDVRIFGPGVLAVTGLYINERLGQIEEADIFINQSLSSGSCLSVVKSDLYCKYLGDLLTHELSHALGLSHSEVRRSSMVYIAGRGQYSLSQDDRAGLRSLYEPENYASLRGTIQGGNGVGIYGVHVQAYSLKNADFVAGVLSQSDGSFNIEGLDASDRYYLYIEPVKSKNNLPPEFKSIRQDFCPDSWKPSFFEGCQEQRRGHPSVIAFASPQKNMDVGVITIRCETSVGLNYLLTKVSGETPTYEWISTPAQPMESFVGFIPEQDLFATSFDASLTEIVKLDLTQLPTTTQAYLEINLASVQLGSAIDFQIKVIGPNGTQIDSDRIGPGVPLLESETLVSLYDRKLYYPLSTHLTDNFIEIHLIPRALSFFEKSHLYGTNESGGSFLLNQDHRWLLSTRIVAQPDPSAVSLYWPAHLSWGDNKRCLDAPFSQSVKAAYVPSNIDLNSDREARDLNALGASCGTIGPPDGPSSGLFFISLSMILLCAFLGESFHQKRGSSLPK